jgi:VTT domain
LLWAEEALRRRGGILIGVGRFIPDGRTATTFAAGTLEMPYRQFVVADAVAVSIWAVYVSMLGYLGGETFQDQLWPPLLASFSCAMLVGLGFEGWRRLQGRRGKDILGDELPGGDDRGLGALARPPDLLDRPAPRPLEVELREAGGRTVGWAHLDQPS